MVGGLYFLNQKKKKKSGSTDIQSNTVPAILFKNINNTVIINFQIILMKTRLEYSSRTCNKSSFICIMYGLMIFLYNNLWNWWLITKSYNLQMLSIKNNWLPQLEGILPLDLKCRYNTY